MPSKNNKCMSGTVPQHNATDMLAAGPNGNYEAVRSLITRVVIQSYGDTIEREKVP